MYLRVEDWAVGLKHAVGVVNWKRNEQIFIFQFLNPLIIALSKKDTTNWKRLKLKTKPVKRNQFNLIKLNCMQVKFAV